MICRLPSSLQGQNFLHVLARRTRALLLDAAAAAESAAETAALMATELDRDEAWVAAQVQEFQALAAGYQVSENPA